MSITNPSTYTEAKAALDQVAEETTMHKSDKERQIDRLRSVQTNLGAMAGLWGEVVTFINAQAVAFPNDQDWQRLKSEQDKLVGDFIAERNAINALVAAINAT